MYRQCAVLAVAIVIGLIASTVLAQCNCGPVATTPAPVVPSPATYSAPASHVTHYSPVTPHITYYAAPAVPTPHVTYYAPPRPHVTYYAPPRPHVAYYAPPIAPRPYVTYYAPPVRPYVAYYGTPGWSVFGAPRVYVPGQPVLNALRAVTP